MSRLAANVGQFPGTRKPDIKLVMEPHFETISVVVRLGVVTSSLSATRAFLPLACMSCS